MINSNTVLKGVTEKMFLNRSIQNIAIIILCMILNIFIVGCKKNNDGNKEPSQPNHQNISAFTLDYNDSDQLQILKSELYLSHISIKQYHMGQNQPTQYHAKDISKIVLHNVMYPGSKEWILIRIDICLKDGSVKSEHAFKAWGVEFGIGHGKGARPVFIEQHFSRNRSLLEQEPKNEIKRT